MKKPPSKVANNRPPIFFQYCQPAQNQPKSHILINKNVSRRDFYIMTLGTYLLDICKGWHTLFSPDYFASATLYFKAWYTLHPNSLWSSTLGLLNKLYAQSLTHFSSKSASSFGAFQGAKCYKEQNVPGSKVFPGANCDKKQSVSGSKMCRGLKCSREPNVMRSKMIWGAKHSLQSVPALWVILVLR